MSRTPRPCSKCPERSKYGECLIQGKWINPDHPSCEYGRKLMDRENSAEYARRKYGYKKRAPKQEVEEEEE